MPKVKTLNEEESSKSDAPEKLEYTKAEEDYIARRRQRQKDMLMNREQRRIQFDGMTYSEWDERNIKADMSYIPPARNRGDTRIVTGTTREKDTTLVSTALATQYTGNIVAFDVMNRIVNGLGEEVEDMVEKSREIEDYDSKKGIIYRSTFARGTTYVMDLWVERNIVEKELPKNYRNGSVDVKWNEVVKKEPGMCETVLWDPRKVVLGDMTQFFIQKQPDILLVDVIPYDTAWELYGDWDRFKYVSKDLVRTVDFDSKETTSASIDWTLCNVEKGKVERRIYMRKSNNELMIELNGVNMLPVVDTGRTDKLGTAIVSAFPLTCMSRSGDYPIAKGDFEPIEGCAISKSNPSKMRVDQEVMDEALKMMILGMKSYRWPAMGNNSGKVLTREDFLPGNIIDDLRKDTVFPVNGMTQGISSGEFSFYELIKRGIEEKSVTGQYEGISGAGANPTATQVLENKKQQMLKLGLALDSIKRLERDLYYLRINSILSNWTKAQDYEIDKVTKGINEVFGGFTLERTPYGRRMRRRKITTFTTKVKEYNQADPMGYRLHEMEDKEKEATGVEPRYSLINPVALRNFKGKWYVVMETQDKKDDTISKMLFVQNITEAKNLFGPQSTNDDKLKQRFAAVIGEDYDTFFKEVDETQMLQQMMNERGDTGSQGLRVPDNKPQKPALKTVLTQ